MHLIYLENLVAGNDVPVSEEENRHLRALRLRDGDELHATNGKGQSAAIRIHWKKSEAIAHIAMVADHAPRSPRLAIAVAPTKNMDRMEWFVEKAVEMGIDEIVPIVSKNSERPILKDDRLRRVAIAAMKQSLKSYLPIIHPLTPLHQLTFEGQIYLAHCREQMLRRPLQDVLPAGQNAMICIGPEGDFTEDEIDGFAQKSAIGVSLGQSRLRTETAALAATHTFNLINRF